MGAGVIRAIAYIGRGAVEIIVTGYALLVMLAAAALIGMNDKDEE